MTFTPYTYRITHHLTGVHYYGVKYGKDANPTTFWVTYFTSSKRVKSLIQKYGKESFTVEIRKTFSDAKAALDWEQRVLKRLNVLKRNDWINDSIGTTFRSAEPKTQEHKDKIGRAHKGISKHLGNTFRLGIPHSDNVKKKMSEQRKGKIWVKLGDDCKQVHREEAEILIATGWTYGRIVKRTKPHSEEAKLKMSKSRTGMKMSKESALKGALSRVGRKWLNNGNREVFATPDSIENLLQLGWIMGRIKD